MTPPDSARSVGCLYLIPTLLGESSTDSSVTPLIARVVSRLSHFLVEEEKSARQFIKTVAPNRNLREVVLARLDERTLASEVPKLLAPLASGIDIGVLSEAGCPAIADPGAVAVKVAHEQGISVKPLVGPCSMILALMASGFNGQRWRFVGYLPVDDGDRRDAIQRLEMEVAGSNETQIFMETPYRNQRLLQELTTYCRPETKLCVASGLTTPAELIQVESIAGWRKSNRTLLKTPTLFLLGN